MRQEKVKIQRGKGRFYSKDKYFTAKGVLKTHKVQNDTYYVLTTKYGKDFWIEPSPAIKGLMARFVWEPVIVSGRLEIGSKILRADKIFLSRDGQFDEGGQASDIDLEFYTKQISRGILIDWEAS